VSVGKVFGEPLFDDERHVAMLIVNEMVEAPLQGIECLWRRQWWRRKR
jgi:hypothetical protein